jgi:site-specific recombinase XerD
LAEAIAWYIADKPTEGQGITPATLAGYRRVLGRFLAFVPESKRTLASVEPETVERFIRTGRSVNTRRNNAIVLRSFATYLAKKKLWYAGDEKARISALTGVTIAKAPRFGQPAYSPQEVHRILRGVQFGRHSLRNRAIVAVELHGLRSKEARLLALRNVLLSGVPPVIVIDDETATKRGAETAHVVIEPSAIGPLRDYLRDRPTFAGSGEEPLFLRDDGGVFSENGWNSMVQRLRAQIKAEGVAFRQHRLRSTSVVLKHEAGWPDSANIAHHRWNAESGMKMLSRYRGRIPAKQLATYPATLTAFFFKAG